MIDAFLGRKQLERSIPCIAAAGVIVAALNWPHERVRVRFSEAAAQPSSADYLSFGSQVDVEVIGRFVGWPISTPLDAHVSAPSGSLATALAVDALVALTICLLAGVFAIAFAAVQERRKVSAVQPSRKSKPGYGFAWVAGLGAAACLGLVVAGLFAHGLVAERRLETALTRHGIISRAMEMPGFVARRLPHWVLLPLAHVESISVHGAPSELVEQSLALPSLRSLTLRNQPINAALWRGVTGSRTLQSLSLVNCKWRAGAVPARAVASASEGNALRSLSIERCNGSSFAESLRHFPNLQSLELTNSSLPVGEPIGQWLPKTLKNLCLTADADAGEVKLAGFEQLKSIVLLPPGRKPSTRGILSVELDDLPQLATVAVPASTRLDLTIKNLPRLQQFVTSTSRHARSTDSDVPAPLQVRDLLIDGVPCLQELHLSSEGLNRLAITRTPNFRSLSIMPPLRMPTGRDDAAHGDTGGRDDVAVLKEDLVGNLATCDGPTSLNLSGLALGGVDLSPLSQNRRIKELVLADSGVRASQLMSIKHDGRIRSLDLQGCDIDQDDLASILADYRDIQQLHVDTNRFETLEIIDQPQLTHLFTTPTRAARRVRIVGCPKLTGTLTLGYGLKQLEIRGAPSLTGLIVKGWLPSDTVLDGLRDLETVELAGRTVSDQHLRALSSCRLLGELTLVMPSISTSALTEIGTFSELMVLKLPGSQLTDKVIAKWGSLPHLREVDFSHTEATAKSIQPFMQCTNLQRLSLAHTKADAGDLGQLIHMKSLLEVDLAGVGLTPSILRRCLAERFIDRINLSGTTLDAESIDMLASEQAKRLLFIGLKDCRLTDDDVVRIATAHPYLAMDIDGNLVSGKVARELNSQGRLIACGDRVGFENWLQHLSTGQPIKDSQGSKKFVRTMASESSRSAWVSSWRSKTPNRSERTQFRVPTWVRRGIEIWNVQ
ncbi:MAG: hypothetical protein ACO1RT_19745 [Planctomycetaceae bacterium]